MEAWIWRRGYAVDCRSKKNRTYGVWIPSRLLGPPLSRTPCYEHGKVASPRLVGRLPVGICAGPALQPSIGRQQSFVRRTAGATIPKVRQVQNEEKRYKWYSLTILGFWAVRLATKRSPMCYKLYLTRLPKTRNGASLQVVPHLFNLYLPHLWDVYTENEGTL